MKPKPRTPPVGRWVTAPLVGAGVPSLAASRARSRAHDELPPHDPDGFLPPHVGERMVMRMPCSPYRVSARELARRFATTPRRAELADGLLRMRADARATGLRVGFQWVGGSFVEERAGDPNDLDVATFFVVPRDWDARASARAAEHLFQPTAARARYGCDAYFVRMAGRRKDLRALTLWYALFSHDRATMRWKGYLELDLEDDEDSAAAELVAAARAGT